MAIYPNSMSWSSGRTSVSGRLSRISSFKSLISLHSFSPIFTILYWLICGFTTFREYLVGTDSDTTIGDEAYNVQELTGNKQFAYCCIGMHAMLVSTFLAVQSLQDQLSADSLVDTLEVEGRCALIAKAKVSRSGIVWFPDPSSPPPPPPKKRGKIGRKGLGKWPTPRRSTGISFSADN